MENIVISGNLNGYTIWNDMFGMICLEGFNFIYLSVATVYIHRTSDSLWQIELSGLTIHMLMCSFFAM